MNRAITGFLLSELIYIQLGENRLPQHPLWVVKNMSIPPEKLAIVLLYTLWLVVWSIWIIFPNIGNVIIPTDELIFFRGVGIPPTSPIFQPWIYYRVTHTPDHGSSDSIISHGTL